MCEVELIFMLFGGLEVLTVECVKGDAKDFVCRGLIWFTVVVNAG